jgi:hypothetical protein
MFDLRAEFILPFLLPSYLPLAQTFSSYAWFFLYGFSSTLTSNELRLFVNKPENG